MRSILPQTEEKAVKAAKSVLEWIRDCPEDVECGRQQIVDEAKFVLDILNLYKQELHACDIEISELKIDNEKLNKVKKIINS